MKRFLTLLLLLTALPAFAQEFTSAQRQMLQALAPTGAIYCSDAGVSDTYVCTVTTAPDSYTTGLTVIFKPNTSNTGAATLNINSLGAKNIVTSANGTPADNDLIAGRFYALVYDGTSLRILEANLSGTVSDAQVPDTITASNYLPLAGGTLTGQLVTDNLGIEFEESDTNPTCAAGNYNIYADLSEAKFKKCTNGVASDLDAGGGTVTVVGGGSLTSTALVTGGGTTTIQTAATTATMDASGNISTPGTITSGSGTTAGGQATLGNATGDTAASSLTINSGDGASNIEPGYVKFWSSHATKRQASIYPCTNADGFFCISAVTPVTDGTSTILTALQSSTVGQVLRVTAANTYTFGAVDLADTDAVTGILAAANGGTGLSSLGTGVATWLGTPSSANLAAALTDETGSGAVVFGTAPTIAGGTHTAITSLGVRSTGTGAFDLKIANTENLTVSDKTLTIALNDANRTLTVAGAATVSGTNTGDQTITLTGDVTGTGTGSFAATLANIPTAVPAAGSIVQTNIAAPASPAAGKVAIFADSTDLRFHDKNASGVIGTTVVADTGASNNFLTAISAAGAISKAQPAFTNISGIATPAQLSQTVNAQTGTTYTYVDGDRGQLVTHTNALAIAATLPNAAGAGFDSGWFMDVQNRGVGTLTITPTISTIDGSATLALTTAQGARVFSDGTNYFTMRGAAAGGSGITSLGGQTGATQTITRGAGIAGSSAGDDHSFTTASQEAGFLADGGVTSLTCGASNQGKVQVLDGGDLEYCDGATTSVLRTGLYSGGPLGTPASGVATNLTGTAAGLTAGNVTTNANLTGHVTSTGNAAVLGSFTVAQLNTAISDADVQPLDAALTALAAGSDFVQFTGPATSTKVFTLPDASSMLLYSGGALGTPSSGSLTNATGLPTAGLVDNAVTAAKSAVVMTRRTCTMVVGADNGSALVDTDLGPQRTQCKMAHASTAVEIDVSADAGTPNVIVGRRRCTTFTAGVCSAWTVVNLTSAALAAPTGGFEACSKTTAVTGLDGGTTCSGTLQNTALSVGDWIELVSGTAGGTAKRMSISVITTVD